MKKPQQTEDNPWPSPLPSLLASWSRHRSRQVPAQLLPRGRKGKQAAARTGQVEGRPLRTHGARQTDGPSGPTGQADGRTAPQDPQARSARRDAGSPPLSGSPRPQETHSKQEGPRLSARPWASRGMKREASKLPPQPRCPSDGPGQPPRLRFPKGGCVPGPGGPSGTQVPRSLAEASSRVPGEA